MQPQTSDVLDLHTFSVSAIRALNMGVVISRRCAARALGSEHLLLALLNQTDGNANKILLHFGVDIFAMRAAADSYLALPSIAPPVNLYFEADSGQRFSCPRISSRYSTGARYRRQVPPGLGRH